jgi:inner membrane protein
MDSLTQIALGAAVSVAVMGRRTAVWKAALWGGIAGTLPDLDVVINHGDPVLNMVRHRAETHSFFYLTLFSPLLAWLVSRIHSEPLDSGAAWGPGPTPGRSQGGPAPSGGSDPRSGGVWGSSFRMWWLAMWLALITHPLLDTMTVYGTQLLMPFSDHPFGVGSVFIIDPAYTLPLIAGVVAALRLQDARQGLRWNAAALVLSTLYLGWSVLAQQHVDRLARTSLQEQGIAAQGLLVTPAPFNTVLWRLVATTPDQYFEGYYSLLDTSPTVRWTAYPRGAELIARHGDNDSVARIAAFSHGFFSLQPMDGHLMLTDLRMGQEPAYIFRFNIGALDAVGIAPPVQQGMRADLGRSLPWLWQRLLGTDVPLPLATQRTGTAVAANP